MAFELPKGVGDFIQGFEIVWREHFSLDDGKVNFDLIEPTAVNGSMDQMQTGVTLLEPLDTGRSAMRGTIVHNPEHAAGLGIGRLIHHPVDQAIKSHNAALRFAVAEKLGPMNIQGGQVSKRSAPLVLVFDLHRLAGLGCLGRMDASTGLDAGLFIGRNDELVCLQGLALPDALVEVQQACGFGSELLFRCTIIWERIIVTIWANPSQARDSVSDGPQFPLMCAAGMRRNGIWEVAQGYFGLRREGPARA